MPITLLDGLLVGFTLVSAVLAMVRGFSREILSVASWVVAAVCAYLFYPLVLPYVQPHIDNASIAQVASAGAVFLVVLIIMTVITMKVADLIIDSGVGALDRTLGFLYGAARGILVVAVGLLFFTWLVPTNQPSWVAEAKSRPFLTEIGQWLESKLPANPEDSFLKRFAPGGSASQSETQPAEAPQGGNATNDPGADAPAN